MTSRFLTVKQVPGKPGQVYYPIQVQEAPIPEPGPRQVLVRMEAVSLNHRDLWIRRHMYPGISFEHPLFSDGYGTIVRAGPDCQRFAADATTGASLAEHQPVVISPIRGWAEHPRGPENGLKFTAVGASKGTPDGTAQEYLVVHEDDIEPAPAHLSSEEAAALPLAGLTAWRALTLAELTPQTRDTAETADTRKNILITGIGGGVALQALQLAVALGVNVYVTSSSTAKLEKARALGACGGVLYTTTSADSSHQNTDSGSSQAQRGPVWPKELAALLPPTRPFLDAVIDGAGGADGLVQILRLLKPGALFVQYGMTSGSTMQWPISAVLQHIQLRGCTMGSRADFRRMLAFVREHRIAPIVSHAVPWDWRQGVLEPASKQTEASSTKGKLVGELGPESPVEGLFEEMKQGRQTGKLVLSFAPSSRI